MLFFISEMSFRKIWPVAGFTCGKFSLLLEYWNYITVSSATLEQVSGPMWETCARYDKHPAGIYSLYNFQLSQN